MSDSAEPLRLAVLIDADNASHKLADKVFAQIAKLGDATVRRVYGEFGGHAKGWAKAINRHAIVPHQQFANVPHKNATDIALVIDAMDLLHGGRLDGFCLVSSDSDYTRLATRIRDHGLKVYGFGKANTPDSFRNACRTFFELDDKPKEVPATELKAQVAAKVTALPSLLAAAERLFLQAMGKMGVGRSWASVEDVHAAVRKLDPDFRFQTYRAGSLNDLIDQIECFQLKNEDGVDRMRMRQKKPDAAPASQAA